MPFKNPYHFVPVAAPAAVPTADLNTKPELSHALYAPNTRSGAISCRLTLKSPTVIGGCQTPAAGGATRVHQFEITGEPAIPASTLRGMIGSVAEAISSSALRVLDKTRYSYHKGVNDGKSLSAIGMVRPSGNGWLLHPITIPTLEGRDDFVLPQRFEKLFPWPNLRVYIGQRDGPVPANNILNPAFGWKTTDPSDASTFVSGNVAKFDWETRPGRPGKYIRPADDLHTHGRFLIGQRFSSDPADSCWGLTRVLGSWGDRADEMPKTKKHELFLPVPENWNVSVPIPASVVKRFEDLADERTAHRKKEQANHPGKADLPFHPLSRPRGSSDGRLRLQDGDLVYFDVDSRGEVSEISFSSVWRDYVKSGIAEPATAHHFFSKVSKELLPFGERREKLTPAELILGFATDEKRSDGLAAYASRIRFSDAALDPAGAGDPYLPEIMLKLLGSPKPPAPPMYFQPVRNERVSKADLNSETNKPQGRKFYLHHHIPPNTSPWETNAPTESTNQKMLATPLRKDLAFTFEIAFDNLTDAELGLLLSAIQPNDGFHHKLGLGKPLGLGSVSLAIEKLSIVDRQSRYTPAGLFTERAFPQHWKAIRDKYKPANSDIAQALKLLGEVPGSADPPVHTPAIGANLERDTFKWFVENERRDNPRALPRLTAQTKTLPTLD